MYNEIIGFVFSGMALLITIKTVIITVLDQYSQRFSGNRNKNKAIRAARLGYTILLFSLVQFGGIASLVLIIPIVAAVFSNTAINGALMPILKNTLAYSAYITFWLTGTFTFVVVYNANRVHRFILHQEIPLQGIKEIIDNPPRIQPMV